MSAGKTFITAIGYLLKALYKLLLLALYGSAKLIETFAGFVVKITEKLMN